MLTVFQSIVLGVVEGATEFLPISSTGHMVLASSLLGVIQSDFTKTFEIVIQLGAICAVVAIYFRSFFDIELIKKLVVAFIPTGVIGLALYHILKTYLLGNEVVVLIALFVGGVVLILFERWHGASAVVRMVPNSAAVERDEPAAAANSLTYKQAFLVGLAQAVAIIPGVSRSGATIVGGLALGISRATIVEFSFLLAVPTMAAATALSLYKGSVLAFSLQQWSVLGIGFLTAFLIALVAVRWLLAYIRSHSFTSFGIYRILLSLVFFAYLFT